MTLLHSTIIVWHIQRIGDTDNCLLIIIANVNKKILHVSELFIANLFQIFYFRYHIRLESSASPLF